MIRDSRLSKAIENFLIGLSFGLLVSMHVEDFWLGLGTIVLGLIFINLLMKQATDVVINELKK